MDARNNAMSDKTTRDEHTLSALEIVPPIRYFFLCFAPVLPFSFVPPSFLPRTWRDTCGRRIPLLSPAQSKTLSPRRCSILLPLLLRALHRCDKSEFSGSASARAIPEFAGDLPKSLRSSLRRLIRVRFRGVFFQKIPTQRARAQYIRGWPAMENAKRETTCAPNITSRNRAPLI